MIARRGWERGSVGVILVVALVMGACGSGGKSTATKSSKATVLRGAGDIRAKVDQFRALLGPDNGGAPGGAAGPQRCSLDSSS